MNETYTINSSDNDDTPSDAAFLARGRIRKPDGTTIVPITIDAKTTAFLDAAHLDYQTFISGVLKAYVASNQPH